MNHQALVLLSLLLAAACGSSDVIVPPADSGVPAGTFRAGLTALDGTKSGGVSVTTKTIPEGYFDADIAVHLINGRPNTTYTVQRAPEVGRALGADGSCQRALGLSPWSSADPAAPAFVTFVPAGGAPVTITTSATGEASVTFDFRVPTVPSGTRFDVMFRLLDDVNAPTSVVMSSCFTVTVI